MRRRAWWSAKSRCFGSAVGSRLLVVFATILIATAGMKGSPIFAQASAPTTAATGQIFRLGIHQGSELKVEDGEQAWALYPPAPGSSRFYLEAVTLKVEAALDPRYDEAPISDSETSSEGEGWTGRRVSIAASESSASSASSVGSEAGEGAPPGERRGSPVFLMTEGASSSLRSLKEGTVPSLVAPAPLVALDQPLPLRLGNDEISFVLAKVGSPSSPATSAAASTTSTSAETSADASSAAPRAATASVGGRCALRVRRGAESQELRMYPLCVRTPGSATVLVGRSAVVEILWVGDLDRDGRLDFIVDRTTHYERSALALYLSSAAVQASDSESVAGLVAVGETVVF